MSATEASAAARMTMAARKIMLSFALIKKHMTILQISMSGARTAIRRIIWQALCTLVTSVVIRVTRPAAL